MLAHQHIVDLLVQRKDAGTLNHAYLLAGPTNVGKRRLARTIAAVLVGTPIEKVTVHPDIRIVARERNEKTGKLRKDIGVDQIRGIRTYAAAGPVMADHSVIVIEQAELLSDSAANSLLKTLEEPHQKTVVFLTVTDVSLVPPTIVSRCQTVYVPVLTKEAMQRVLPDVSAAVLDAAHGLAEVAQTLHADPHALETYEERKKTFAGLFGLPLYEKRHMIEYLFESKEDHIAGRADILEHTRLWKLFLRDMLCASDTRLTPMQGVQMYDTLDVLESQIRQNVHPRAAVDAFLLTIP